MSVSLQPFEKPNVLGRGFVRPACFVARLMKPMLRNLLLASFLFAAGCSDTVAYADQVAVQGNSPQIALAVSPARIRAPYDVQIMRENGETLPTYAQKDRYYVQGNAGERYIIRVVNPTPRRVEAVVTVDGLDVVDGESGDLRKRGYVEIGRAHV